MAKKRKQNDPLATLLETAPKTKLVDLLVRVTGMRPDVRRKCLDYVNRHIALSPSQKKQSEDEELLAGLRRCSDTDRRPVRVWAPAVAGYS